MIFFDKSITFGTWIHTAMVYKGSGIGMDVFLDGNYVGASSPAYPDEFRGTPSRDLMIGRFLGSQNKMKARYADVDVDELLIWNRMLNEGDIAIVMKMADNVRNYYPWET